MFGKLWYHFLIVFFSFPHHLDYESEMLAQSFTSLLVFIHNNMTLMHNGIKNLEAKIYFDQACNSLEIAWIVKTISCIYSYYSNLNMVWNLHEILHLY